MTTTLEGVALNKARSAEDSDNAHDCDGCGEAKPDVDLWAQDAENGEETWLCVACGDW